MPRSGLLRKSRCTTRKTYLYALLICVLSCGILLTVASNFLSSKVIAASAHNTTAKVITHVQPTSASKSSSPMKASQAHKPSNNQPHVALPVGPDLGLNLTANASSYVPGQTVAYTLGITNNAAASPILAGAPINVTDVLPAGLTNIIATTLPGQWSLSLTATTSPTIVSAIYTGPTPISSGQVLAPITVAGLLTPGALGTFSNTASVSVPGDVNLTDNVMTLSISVSSVAATATATPIAATATATPIAATATATPIAATATATPIAATATATPTSLLPPDLSIIQSFGNGTSLQVGQTVTITLTINNGASAGPLPQGNSVLVNDILPLGLDQISIGGGNWFAFVTSSTGPALFSAIYTGSTNIGPGGALPPLTVTGTLDANILPGLVNTASVSTSGDVNLTNNVSIGIVTVLPALAPDLNILQTIIGPGTNNKAVSGQQVTITLAITNSASAGTLAQAGSISVNDVLPAGLSQIVATGNNWFTLSTSTSGPALLTGICTFSGPLLAGQSLPLLTIRGVVNTNVGGTTLTNTASVSVPGDGNTANNTTTTTFYISVPETPTVPVSGTPTAPTPVVTPSASAFISPGVKCI